MQTPGVKNWQPDTQAPARTMSFRDEGEKGEDLMANEKAEPLKPQAWIETELWNFANGLLGDLNLPERHLESIHKAMAGACIAYAAHAPSGSPPRRYEASEVTLSTACEKCDSVCFITAGTDHLVCYHCWLHEQIERLESASVASQEAFRNALASKVRGAGHLQAEAIVRTFPVASQEAAPLRTCPTCGTALCCKHGKLFTEKCVPCEEATGRPSQEAAQPQGVCATCGSSPDATVHRVETYRRVPGGYGHPFVAEAGTPAKE
jgi:hypothetical protein